MNNISELNSNRARIIGSFLDENREGYFENDQFLSVKNWLALGGRNILDHDAVFCGKATRHAFGFVVEVMLGSRLPIPYVNRIARGASITCPALENWFLLRKPTFVSVHRDTDENTYSNIQTLLRKHELENVAVYGVVEKDSRHMTFTALYGISEEWNACTIEKLRFISSSVHEKLMRCSSVNHPSNDLLMLSDAEQKIVEWLRRDKSNWEIAQILGKSEGTVKNQVKKIFMKLGINKRGSIHQYFTSTTVQLFS